VSVCRTPAEAIRRKSVPDENVSFGTVFGKRRKRVQQENVSLARRSSAADSQKALFPSG